MAAKETSTVYAKSLLGLHSLRRTFLRLSKKCFWPGTDLNEKKELRFVFCNFTRRTLLVRIRAAVFNAFFITGRLYARMFSAIDAQLWRPLHFCIKVATRPYGTDL